MNPCRELEPLLATPQAPFGCPLCSCVKFCSKACLQEACATYHPSECLLTDLVMGNRHFLPTGNSAKIIISQCRSEKRRIH
jgi:hypothetical protein